MADIVAQGRLCCHPRSSTSERPLAPRSTQWTLPAPHKAGKRERQSCCSATMSNVEEARGLGTSWFTQPVECLRTVEHPSKEASVLEKTFWHHPVMEVPATRDEAMVMMERLHQETASQTSADGVNVIAFTGGNGPALLAYLLNNLFDGSVVGCIGNLQGLSQQHVEHTRFVADLLGIDLIEVDGQTWSRFDIPAGLDSDAEELCSVMGAPTCNEAGLTFFSGATADDVASFNRGGGELRGIVAPLSSLSRAAVNSLSKIVGLPDFEEQVLSQF